MAWSPDGRQLAFAEWYGSLILIRTDDAEQRPLTMARTFDPSTRTWSGEIVSDPAWSPNGSKIAFAADGNFEGLDLYVMNTDGSGRTRLTSNGRDPAWSPDGTRIAFSADLDNGDFRIEVVNADGSGRRVVTAKKGMWYLSPSWSPDGKWIVFVSAPHEDWGWISMVRPDGSGRRCLTGQQDKPIPANPVWSPDGTRVAFDDGGISTVDADGSNVTRISNSGLAPAWSPDGTKIAFFR